MSLEYSSASEVWAQAADSILNPVQGIPLHWWPRMTDMIGGLRPHELTLLCAPTGAGKTQLLANISAQMLEQKVPHFVAPVETGGPDFLIRVISALHKFDFNGGSPGMGHRLEAATKEHIDLILNGKMTIASYDNRVDVEDMANMLKYQYQTYGTQVAILDNLNFFLKVVSSQMERVEMDNAVHEFVMLVKKLPMHIILVVHPKKTDGGRVLSEFDIKGSSTAVQECANVLLFNRPSEEHMAKRACPYTDRELVFRKIRKRGQNVGIPLWFAFGQGRYFEERRA